MQELLIPFGFHQLVQDGFAPVLGEADLFAISFNPLFQPGGLFGSEMCMYCRANVPQ